MATAPNKTKRAKPLDAVHIASTAEPAPGKRLNMPKGCSPEQAVETIRREALRWTYLLRSRKRWVGDQRARERNEHEAQTALKAIGIDENELRALAQSDTLAVRIPWTGDERVHWESRIFPWEYVLAAATRQQRLQNSTDGRPRRLSVLRELQRQPLAAPQAKPPAAGKPPRLLFVECVPSELARQWSVEPERKRLAQVLPEGTEWHVLKHPTLEELERAVADRQPHFVHFAGLDSHQGLRELRAYFGTQAMVDVGDEGLAILREQGMETTAEVETPLTPQQMLQAKKEQRLRLVDEVTANPRVMVDGLLLRNDDGLPELVRAHRVARALRDARQPAWLMTFNVWNSAARLAPLMVGEGAAAAAVGFQDAFDDALADFVHATLYRRLAAHGWQVPAAFIDTWSEVRELPESVDATGITLWTDSPVLPLARSRKPVRRALREPSTDIRCVVKPYPELNYAVVHNAQPLFEKFVLECDSPGPERLAAVEVAVHMGAETARFQRLVRMDKSRVALTRDIHVPLTAQVARAVHEAIGSSVEVKVADHHRNVLLLDTFRLRLLPVDQWRDNRRDGRWLPSFVQPRDPAVQRAVERAQRYNRVLRDDPNAGFEGYQAADSADEGSLRNVDRQVEAIWATLLHDWQLGYINPPPAYSGALDSQRLRTPSMVLEHRCGTCIDLALLFAACLELIDIYPVIFLLEGHALPGWWRHPEFRDEYAEMSGDNLADVVSASASENSAANAQLVSWHTGKASHDEIKRWIRQRKLVPIETVRLTENCGFVEAIEAGVEALKLRRDFDSMLEIVTARYEQVTPLPLLKEAL